MTIKPKIATKFKVCFLGLFSLLSNLSYSQDVHFSQSVVSIQQRNFAISNFYGSEFQVYSAYREQWGAISTPFQSSILGVNAKVSELSNGIKLFSGIQYFNDESGDGKLSINQFSLNVAAAYELEDNLFLIGISNGFNLKQFNANQLTFPEQYDRSIGGFNEKLGNGENLNNQKLSYWTLGLNLGWKKEINKKWTIITGLSLDHLNQPNESFYNQAESLGIGLGIQGIAEYQLKKKLTLLPYLNYYNLKSASETVIGSGIQFDVSEESNVKYIQPFLYSRLGFSRNIDALIIGTHIGLRKIDIGASYDFNISDLELASNYQGAFELSLVYTPSFKTIKKRAIPCERL